jgi:ribulose-5-phosphate 4-epimerase/fuculose-1-phosphate aldolase
MKEKLTSAAGFSERFIHSEIYKAYPSITSVIHSHALPVIPFSISAVQPLAACFHMAGFLGCRVPVWDFADAYAAEELAQQQDMLVRNSHLGASLAKSLRGDEESPAHSDSNPTDVDEVPNVVALMRGHGMVVIAQSIEMCVLRAIYTVQNAKILQAAKGLGGGDVKVLSEREVADTRNTTAKGAVKPWPLWVREVESAGGIYRNLA